MDRISPISRLTSVVIGVAVEPVGAQALLVVPLDEPDEIPSEVDTVPRSRKLPGSASGGVAAKVIVSIFFHGTSTRPGLASMTSHGADVVGVALDLDLGPVPEGEHRVVARR